MYVFFKRHICDGCAKAVDTMSEEPIDQDTASSIPS
jgi:hypothetical protein